MSMNERLTELLKQMDEMKLSETELENLCDKYETATSKSGILIHTAAMMLAVKSTFTR